MEKVQVIYTKPPHRTKLVSEYWANILVSLGVAQIAGEEATRNLQPERKRTYKRRDMKAEE